MKTKLLCLAVFICNIYGATANEWPMAHSWGHSGFSPTTTLKPPLRIKWVTKANGLISGESGNGPVAAEGKVVVQGVYHQLFCFDESNGQLVWRYSIPDANLGFHFLPCISDGRVYAVFAVKGKPEANGIRCLDLNTGDSLWKQDAGVITSFRFKESPQVSNGRVFLHSIRDTNKSTLAAANYHYASQVQAWDAVTGEPLWTYTLTDSIDAVRVSNNFNIGYNTAMCVVGDTIFASMGGVGGTPPSYHDSRGVTVALIADGRSAPRVLWSNTQQFVTQYVGSIQYVNGRVMLNGGKIALNVNDGTVISSFSSGADPYGKIGAVMNNAFWNRSYGDVPVKYDFNSGAKLLICKINEGETWGTGCSAPTVANGYVYSGMGAPIYVPGNAPALCAWDEQGNPAWWFHTSTNACQSSIVSGDCLYWVTHLTGEMYCFESDTREVASLKAICLPETLEQYTVGTTFISIFEQNKPTVPAKVRAIVSFSDGSKDTTEAGCLFKSLDTFNVFVSNAGNITAKQVGSGRIEVSRYGVKDTVTVYIVPTKATVDSVRLNFSSRTIGVGDTLDVDARGYFRNSYGSFSAIVDTYSNWESSNPSVVDVKCGKLVGLSSGESIRITVDYQGKKDTLSITVVNMPSIIKRINFQTTSIPPRAGWIADSGFTFPQADGAGWVKPSDINVRRADRGGTNPLLATFINTARPTDYRIDIPDGEYVIRMGLGDRTWGSTAYSYVLFAGDTLFHRVNGMPNINIETRIIQVSGENGLTLTLSGFICYLVIASTEHGANILCSIADDDFTDPGCSTTEAVFYDESSIVKTSFELAPNPFNPVLQLYVTLSSGMVGKLIVCDLNGNQIRLLYNGQMSKGRQHFLWDGKDERGYNVATGMYLFKLQTGGKVLLKKATLLR